MQSTAPLDVESEEAIPSVHYVYDAAAERAKELDRMEREEKEKERLRREQTRSSMQRVPVVGLALHPWPSPLLLLVLMQLLF